MVEPRSSLFEELKRRRVFRVAGVYVVVGFGVIEGADLLFPRLGLPDWTITLVVGLVLLGFPLAVALAWAFDFTPDGIRRTPSADPAASGPRPGAALRIAAVGGALVLAAAGAGFFLTRGDEPPPDLDPRAVAVLPFRVGGADPSLAYLREGVVDLLAAKLTGEAGPRAVNPRTMLTAWRSAAGGNGRLAPDEARALARQLGAGKLVMGEVVGTQRSLTVQAELIDTETGRSTEAEQSGSVEDLTRLVDRIAATLMALEAGESRPRLEQLTTTSLPALRSYLQGQSAFRSGRYADAAEYFESALEEDSTFALAAMGMSEALRWWPERPGEEEALRLAWKFQDRLSARDRTYLRAFAGPNYPRQPSRAEELATYEAALDQAPDDPMLWYHVGDVLYHSGLQLDEERPLERAAVRLERALELDPAFAPAAEHLFALTLRTGDVEASRAVGEQYLEMNADAEGTIRWWLGQLPNPPDSTPRLADLDTRDLQRIFGWTADAGLAVDSAEAALAILRERLEGGTPFQAAQANGYSVLWAQRRGRYARARELQNGPMLGLLQAVYGPAGPNVGSAAAERMREAVGSLDEGDVRDFVRFLLAQWSLRTGDPAEARRLVEEYRPGSDSAESGGADERELLALLLDAELAVREGRPDAADRVRALDRAALRVPQLGWLHEPALWTELANLTLIHLHDALGESEAALAASRRRAFTVGSTTFLATMLREEGRLAEQLGRPDEAVEAYRMYLEFRGSDADAPIQEEMAEARAALERLTAEGR